MIQAEYLEEEKNAAIREYFSADSEGYPRCPLCGEEFQISLDYSARLRIRASCPGCHNGFSWDQPEQAGEWRKLDLNYFLERYRRGQILRCPQDDSVVGSLEFSEGVVEFRCPFCNRRGRAEVPVSADEEPLVELE